jgi:hypothetical protein
MNKKDAENYNKTCGDMYTAALAWKEKHKELAWGSLVFKPLGYSEGVFVAAPLDEHMIRKVGGNALTRTLLDVLDSASGREASVAQAEMVIERVFGIRRALTGRPEQSKARETEKEVYHYEPRPCPDCGYKMDSATTTIRDGRGPRAGDFTVCLECAAALVFTADMGLRAATLEETSKAPVELMNAVKAVSEMALGRRK